MSEKSCLKCICSDNCRVFRLLFHVMVDLMDLVERASTSREIDEKVGRVRPIREKVTALIYEIPKVCANYAEPPKGGGLSEGCDD